MRNAVLGALLLAAGLSAGCVTRRYTITSAPLGAMVYANGVQLGPTPVDGEFVYYGKYRFTLVKDGYETLEVEQEIPAPWYEIPGIDFISENVLLYRFRDRHVFHYNMVPLQAVRHDDVLRRATDLRARGRAVGAPGADAPAPRTGLRGPVAPIGSPTPPPPPGPPSANVPPPTLAPGGSLPPTVAPSR